MLQKSSLSIFLLLVYGYSKVTRQSEIKQAMYHLSTLCNISIDPYEVTELTRGRTHCGVRCLSNSSCIAFNYTDAQGCSLYLGDLTPAVFCTTNETDMTSLYVREDELPPIGNQTETEQTTPSTQSPEVTDESTPEGPPPPPPPPPPLSCDNGGLFDAILYQCNCTSGWVGEYCNQTANGCLELSNAGYRTDGPYMIHPPTSPDPFEVLCSLSLGYALTPIQQRFSSTSTFNRTWQEFKDGFHISGWTDFWLGNEKIHYLTTSSSMRLFLHVSNDTKRYQRFYGGFQMANEDEQFAVSYASSWGVGDENMADCWPQASLPFSTYDRDNDNVEAVNCAAVHGAGWWFDPSSNCTICNLNGRFLNGAPYTGDVSEAFISPLESTFSPIFIALSLWPIP